MKSERREFIGRMGKLRELRRLGKLGRLWRSSDSYIRVMIEKGCD
jgi:hypothetical protein